VKEQLSSHDINEIAQDINMQNNTNQEQININIE
jgi:hypothetical protein